jgi:hypothetical protein
MTMNTHPQQVRAWPAALTAEFEDASLQPTITDFDYELYVPGSPAWVDASYYEAQVTGVRLRPWYQPGRYFVQTSINLRLSAPAPGQTWPLGLYWLKIWRLPGIQPECVADWTLGCPYTGRPGCGCRCGHGSGLNLRGTGVDRLGGYGMVGGGGGGWPFGGTGTGTGQGLLVDTGNGVVELGDYTGGMLPAGGGMMPGEN